MFFSRFPNLLFCKYIYDETHHMISLLVNHKQVFNVLFFFLCYMHLLINSISPFVFYFFQRSSTGVKHATLCKVVMEAFISCSCFSMLVLISSAMGSTIWALVICWDFPSWDLDFHMWDRLSMYSAQIASLYASARVLQSFIFSYMFSLKPLRKLFKSCVSSSSRWYKYCIFENWYSYASTIMSPCFKLRNFLK